MKSIIYYHLCWYYIIVFILLTPIYIIYFHLFNVINEKQSEFNVYILLNTKQYG